MYFYCFTSTLKLGRTYVGFTKYKSNHLGHDGVEPLGQCEEEADGLDGDAIPDFTNLWLDSHFLGISHVLCMTHFVSFKKSDCINFFFVNIQTFCLTMGRWNNIKDNREHFCQYKVIKIQNYTSGKLCKQSCWMFIALLNLDFLWVSKKNKYLVLGD